MDADVRRSWFIALCVGVTAVLALFTSWRGRRASRERLTLRLRAGSAGEATGVEVFNESAYPVKVVGIRRVMRDGKREELSQLAANENGEVLPFEIAARHAVKLRFGFEDMFFYLKASDIQLVTVETATGNVFTTGSVLRAAWRSVRPSTAEG